MWKPQHSFLRRRIPEPKHSSLTHITAACCEIPYVQKFIKSLLEMLLFMLILCHSFSYGHTPQSPWINWNGKLADISKVIITASKRRGMCNEIIKSRRNLFGASIWSSLSPWKRRCLNASHTGGNTSERWAASLPATITGYAPRAGALSAEMAM